MHFLLTAILATISIGPMGPDAPDREPQMAVRGSTVALTFGAGNSIYFSRSDDSGKTFSVPVKVAESAIIPLTRHRGPRIVFSGSAIAITAVTGRTAATGEHSHGLPSDGDLLVWRSGDSGRTWSKGKMVNDVPGAPTEGLHALAADAKGTLFAAWLDKRDRQTKLYGSRSTDGGQTWSRNVPIYASPDGTICECCHPSLAFDSDSSVLVMWRNWLNGSRDMYLAQSKDGIEFSKSQKLGNGTWKLNACPMDGGGIAVSGKSVTTVWRREHSLFLDKPGDPEVPIGEGTDVAIAGAAEGLYLIWSAPDSLMVMTPGSKEPHPIGMKGSFPTIVALPGGNALAAWEDGARIAIHYVK
jgi:hypothetical protein